MIKKLILILLFLNFLNANTTINQSFTYKENSFLSVEDVIKQKHKFEKFELNSPMSFGYDLKHNIIVKLTIKNDTNRVIEKNIVSKNPLVSKVVLHDDKGKELEKQGFLQEHKNKTLYSSFSIILKPNEDKTYYLSFESPQTTLIINLDVVDKKKHDSWYVENILFISLFFGGMLALCIYNLFVFFATKDKAYLFYTLCIFATTFHHSAYTGILFLFANIKISELTFTYSAIVVSLPMYFLGLFSKYYLETKNFKRIDKTINAFLIIIPITWVFFILFPEFSKFRNTFSFVFLFYLLCIAIYLAFHKVKQSYYVIFGWFLFFLSGIFMVLSSSGTYTIFTKFPHIVEFLLFSEAILFSIALSNRIRTLQNQIIVLKEKKEQELKKEVELKTQKLSKSLEEKKLLLKELSHRVKNNMQMILSLIRLQSREQNSKEFSKMLVTIEGRISALGHLHELLYRQDDIISINAKDYFDLLINDLASGYDIENLKVKFKSQFKGLILVDHAIYCGLIINELVTNSLKHAFKDNEGEISVFFEEQEEKYILKYSDNGVGYQGENNKDSLGILIIETLAQEQLEGELEINGNEGMNLSLEWSKDLKDE